MRAGKRAVRPMLLALLGKPLTSATVHAWKYKFAECLSLVHIQAYSAVPPAYATVLDLNRKLEAFPTLEAPTFDAADPQAADLYMQRHMSKAVKQEGQLCFLLR